VSPAVSLGFVFFNPLYFFLVLAADVRQRARALALGGGAALGPLFHLVTPDWGLLATGLVAGTLAWGADRWWRRRRA
jgi:hypothetical protein